MFVLYPVKLNDAELMCTYQVYRHAEVQYHHSVLVPTHHVVFSFDIPFVCLLAHTFSIDAWMCVECENKKKSIYLVVVQMNGMEEQKQPAANIYTCNSHWNARKSIPFMECIILLGTTDTKTQYIGTNKRASARYRTLFAISWFACISLFSFAFVIVIDFRRLASTTTASSSHTSS